MKPTILALAAVLLFGGCSEARRIEKKRRDAEALVKEAIETYPGIMQPVVTTDTITLISPPVIIKERVGYSQASVDSLASICNDLLKAERGSRTTVVQRFTTNVCNLDTAMFSKGSVDVMVWAKNGVLDIAVMKHAEQLDTAVVTSTRTINATPCPPKERVKSWFWVGAIIGFILGAAAMLFVRGGNRYE